MLIDKPTHLLESFIQSVKTMRQLQRQYFAARKQHLPEAGAILTKAREAEAEVDKLIQDLNQEPELPNLFTTFKPAKK